MMRDLYRIKVLFLGMFLQCFIANACDVCSCGSSNSNSFSSALKGNFVGLTYSYLHFTYKEGISNNSPVANDYIQTLNITGQYQLKDNVQIHILVPYRYNNRKATDGEINNQGFGDVVVYGMYELFNKEDKHILKLGGGVKLPTGKFDLSIADFNKTSAIQLGTGSLDILFPVQYQFENEKSSITVSGMYFLKNKNKEEFKFGNQTQINTTYRYKIDLKKDRVFVPNINLNYDHFLPSERFEITDKRSKGYMLNTTIGADLFVENWVFGANYSLPIKQNLIENEVVFKKGLGLYTYWRF